ncbi:uncharacterized protein LOC124371682 [Homalodisca vitripennis]|uniref:uncharacterized protein LOC124371682 n=1 Tax=Homalodisca vitripennis TaxID=197043 RepID=UPI001EEC4EF2|nr:uncharacterized protein LOC124371682 [Homalodisca vitripennis]
MKLPSVQRIFIQPPEFDGDTSAEDSADEDDGGKLDNLPKTQLAGFGEAVFWLMAQEWGMNMTKCKHGFLRGKSTTTAIVHLSEFIIDQLEEGATVTAMLLDFSKAFDCLNHSLLLQKVENMGSRGASQNWLASYLKDRQQLVEVPYTTNNKHIP